MKKLCLLFCLTQSICLNSFALANTMDGDYYGNVISHMHKAYATVPGEIRQNQGTFRPNVYEGQNKDPEVSRLNIKLDVNNLKNCANGTQQFPNGDTVNFKMTDCHINFSTKVITGKFETSIDDHIFDMGSVYMAAK